MISIASPTAMTPDFAYPFASGDELTTANVEDFQQLAYRPLYFFGGSPTIAARRPPCRSRRRPSTTPRTPRCPSRSGPGAAGATASPSPPRASSSGSTCWRRSPACGGTTSRPLPSGQVLGIPDDLREVTVSGPTVTLSLAAPVNPTWFTDSELSQITPLPGSWDRYEPSHPHVPLTGPASVTGEPRRASPARPRTRAATRRRGSATATSGPGTAFVDPLGTRTVVPPSAVAQAQRCVDVVELYRSMAFDTADYTTPGTDVAAAFGTSDGPWRLATLPRATGAYHDGAEPGRGGVGPAGRRDAPLLRAVRERRELRVAPGATAWSTRGRSRSPTRRRSAPSPRVRRTTRCTPRAIASRSSPRGRRRYMPYNFASTSGARGHAGRVFSQLYFRQAFQSLVDQPAVIDQDLGGYGVATTGPIPTTPATAFATTTPNPAPYSTSRGRGAALEARLARRAGQAHDLRGARPSADRGIPRGTPLVLHARVRAVDGRPLAVRGAPGDRRGQGGRRAHAARGVPGEGARRRLDAQHQLGPRELGRRVALRAGLLPLGRVDVRGGLAVERRGLRRPRTRPRSSKRRCGHPPGSPPTTSTSPTSCPSSGSRRRSRSSRRARRSTASLRRRSGRSPRRRGVADQPRVSLALMNVGPSVARAFSSSTTSSSAVVAVDAGTP